jgi:glycosyltransferase involved in cell wall biosynthesis
MTAPGADAPRARLSIVIPHYHHEDKLGEAVGALAAQTRPPDEVIVVDDGSGPESLAAVRTILARFPLARLVRHERNRGVNAACRTGLEEARGDFIAFTAADDLVSPTMVERASAAIAAHPETGLLFSDLAEMDEAGGQRRILPLALSDGTRHFSPPEFRRALRRSFFFLTTGNVWFGAAALRSFGGFDERLRWHADLFAAYGIGLARGATYVPGAITYFRVSPGSYSAKGRRSAAQVPVLEAWLAKTREPTDWDCRAAFVEAAVLPDYGFNAVRALRSDPSYVTATLLRRIVARTAWDAIRPLMPWRARRAVRKMISSRA